MTLSLWLAAIIALRRFLTVYAVVCVTIWGALMVVAAVALCTDIPKQYRYRELLKGYRFTELLFGWARRDPRR